MTDERVLHPGTGQPFKARDLRVVDNNTAEFDGGHSVELADGTIIAGPYAAVPDARQAKRDLIEGRRPRGSG